MNELKFNSQICTTKEQSERLLELGLKPETADMEILVIGDEEITQFVGFNITADGVRINNVEIEGETISYIPAWSLHRLMEIRFAGDNLGLGVYNIHNRNFGNCYEILISVIEYLIKIGEFNKEYLEQ